MVDHRLGLIIIFRTNPALVENTFSQGKRIDLPCRFSQHSTEIPGEVLFPQDGPLKTTQLSTQIEKFHREPPVLGTPPNLSDQNLEVRGEDFPSNRIILRV